MNNKDIRICLDYSNEELAEIIKKRERNKPTAIDIIKCLKSLKKDYLLCKHNTNSTTIDNIISFIKEKEKETQSLESDVLELRNSAEKWYNKYNELLRKQEPVKPATTKIYDRILERELEYDCCENCKQILYPRPNYCPLCGKPILWEGR